MKIRNGFVSNSSSSSFVCEVCGSVEVGYDAGLEEFDMKQCAYGHIFHDYETNDLTEENFTLAPEIASEEKSLKKRKETIKEIEASLLDEKNQVEVDGEIRYKYKRWNDEEQIVSKEKFLDSKSYSYIKKCIKESEALIEKFKSITTLSAFQEELERLEDDNDYYNNPISAFLEDEETHSLIVECPICSMAHISDYDIAAVALKKLGANKTEFKEQIKSQFETYQDLASFVRGE